MALIGVFPTTPNASPRQGTWLIRPNPRHQIEGTLFRAPDQQGEPRHKKSTAPSTWPQFRASSSCACEKFLIFKTKIVIAWAALDVSVRSPTLFSPEGKLCGKILREIFDSTYRSRQCELRALSNWQPSVHRKDFDLLSTNKSENAFNYYQQWSQLCHNYWMAHCNWLLLLGQFGKLIINGGYHSIWHGVTKNSCVDQL